MSLLSRFLIAMALLVIITWFLKPSQEKYLMHIAEDYGAAHQGSEFSPAQLLELGEGHMQDFILWNSYTYNFGNIGVQYVGFLGMTFKSQIITAYQPVKPKKNGIQV